METTISKEYYFKLKQLLTGSSEDCDLVMNVLNHCNPETSFTYILCLLTQKKNEFFVGSSHVIGSHVVSNYIAKIINMPILPVEWNLDTIVSTIGFHNEACLPENKITERDKKFILSEYVPLTLEKSNLFDFKLKITPKKK